MTILILNERMLLDPRIKPVTVRMPGGRKCGRTSDWAFDVTRLKVLLKQNTWTIGLIKYM